MSNTPRTDAQYDFFTALRVAKERVKACPLYRRFIYGTPLSNDIAVWIAVAYCEGANFARQLERELAEARERCCQAINDYETAVLREHRMQEQRDTLVEVLKLCEKHLEKHGHEKCDEELDETGWWLLCDVRTALAAVKGGNK